MDNSVQSIDFDTWNEFENYIEEFSNSKNPRTDDIHYKSQLLYRGHESANWGLDTTLERSFPWLTRLNEYYRTIAAEKAQLETFTGRVWNDIDSNEISENLSNYDSLAFNRFPAYEYLVYLRHHGFPSPLLDWSRSLYVATYFAFESAKSDRVAIFVYQEYTGGSKSSSSGNAQIRQLGPNVRSHPRHFLQQAEYTVALNFKDGTWHFATHEDVFTNASKTQDQLWKFTIPATEASKVMKRLDDYNINAFSLFQTEDALLKTIANRHARKKSNHRG